MIEHNRNHPIGPLSIVVAIVLACLTLLSATPAIAQDAERVQLGIKPVGVEGSYFELTMEPGESRQLTVELGNFGTLDAVAMTYPADVYSLVNGGMGVRLAGEPTSGTTTWVGYAAETVPLEAGKGALRTFAVSVPDDAAAGEYITSIVVQDATPAGDATSGGVVANRVNRQAIAVAITVPGPITPALTLGTVAHHVSGGRSVITVEVENSGNVRLQPSGELVLTASAGGEPQRFPVTMDSVYAGTKTVAEIAFPTLLDPGEYVASFTLADPNRAIAATTVEAPLSISKSTLAVSAPAPSTSAPATMTQPAPSRAAGTTLLAAVLASGVIALGLGWLVVSKRGEPRLTGPAAASPAVVANSAAIGNSRPATIRQLDVPKRSLTPEQQPETAQFRMLDRSRTSPRFAATTASNTLKGA